MWEVWVLNESSVIGFILLTKHQTKHPKICDCMLGVKVLFHTFQSLRWMPGHRWQDGSISWWGWGMKMAKQSNSATLLGALVVQQQTLSPNLAWHLLLSLKYQKLKKWINFKLQLFSNKGIVLCKSFPTQFLFIFRLAWAGALDWVGCMYYDSIDSTYMQIMYKKYTQYL